ncbi:MAG: 23S rRNA (adenine(2503)-C(2))-methyltransferase RlmN [Dehalococcoidia bacterium]|nr:23S rRNA (adenine(2503)-C(2))-methyltransferase RlmN [Dehalococcoidia bacterium]MSQ16671.1 23S rRNA (adenine(2503)-C(2))-methyltransferase RlmN [Dehalococcoidia bacterium]
MNTAELSVLAQQAGESAYRGQQIARWIYRRGARSISDMTDLSKPLRARLEEQHQVGRSRVAAQQRSRDGTVKFLLALTDEGGGMVQTVETVGLPYAHYLSCCVSTQVGCPVRCAFCATGASGYTRNLTAGEIVDQLLTVQDTATGNPPPLDRVSHVVFMGMGEPLMNYDATVQAVRLLNTEVGIGMRHLTVSTVGYVPGIRRLAQERMQITLAVSLHAPNDQLRQQLIPTMTRWSLDEILDACKAYFKSTGRRLTFEYCLLAGVNDGVRQARELGHRLRGLNCHVNLIPYNPVGKLGFGAPAILRVNAFREVLEQMGIVVTQRAQKGSDIDAACGQLRRRDAAERVGATSPS